MSRADSKTALQTKIAKVQKNIDSPMSMVITTN